MEEFIYILAPNTTINRGLLTSFSTLYPNLVQEKRLKNVHKKHPSDVIDEDGDALAKVGEAYLLVKATASEFSLDMIEGAEGAETYSDSELPFNEFWL